MPDEYGGTAQVGATLLPVTISPSPSEEKARRWGKNEKEALDAFNLPATLAGEAGFEAQHVDQMGGLKGEIL